MNWAAIPMTGAASSRPKRPSNDARVHCACVSGRGTALWTIRILWSGTPDATSPSLIAREIVITRSYSRYLIGASQRGSGLVTRRDSTTGAPARRAPIPPIQSAPRRL